MAGDPLRSTSGSITLVRQLPCRLARTRLSSTLTPPVCFQASRGQTADDGGGGGRASNNHNAGGHIQHREPPPAYSQVATKDVQPTIEQELPFDGRGRAKLRLSTNGRGAQSVLIPSASRRWAALCWREPMSAGISLRSSEHNLSPFPRVSTQKINNSADNVP